MYIRTRDDAMDALGAILELPERRAQIVQSTVKVALCMTPEARTFMLDVQAGILSGGLDALRERRQAAVQKLTDTTIRRKAPGRIVTLSSVSGVMGNRGQVNYSASKAGIIGATKALAVELASRRITVNCVAPGLIRTDMMNDAPVEEVLKAVPMGRVGEPAEVAAVVNFLMSRDAAYITRQVIGVNGGMI